MVPVASNSIADTNNKFKCSPKFSRLNQARLNQARVSPHKINEQFICDMFYEWKQNAVIT